MQILSAVEAVLRTATIKVPCLLQMNMFESEFRMCNFFTLGKGCWSMTLLVGRHKGPFSLWKPTTAIVIRVLLLWKESLRYKHIIAINRKCRLFFYRLLWNAEPRAVEVYPCDGSIICSTGHTGRHYVHYLFNNSTRQVSCKRSNTLVFHNNNSYVWSYCLY